MDNTNKAPRVKLTPNLEKILASICFVLEQAKEKELEVTQYDIVKTLFLADRQHLNTYGRLITFDTYRAMQHGPVPSLAYNLLKENKHTLNKYKLAINDLSWNKTKAPHISPSVFVYTLKKNKKCDLSSLSDSDTEMLEKYLKVVKSLTFSQLRNLTHEDPAYKEANPNAENINPLMSLGMLFEGNPNFEAAEHVEFLSKHQ
jgi:uncharacterized phage-associated protein